MAKIISLNIKRARHHDFVNKTNFDSGSESGEASPGRFAAHTIVPKIKRGTIVHMMFRII